MNILHVSAFDIVGAQVNGYLLHKYLLENGIDSQMAVHQKGSSDPEVHQLDGPFKTKVNSVANLIEKELSTAGFLPLRAFNLYLMDCYKRADIVHVHLPHVVPFFSLFNLPLLSRRKKLVLSVHDMFLLTGHCVYPPECERWKTGCGSCPDLKRTFEIKRDTTAFSWRLKKTLMGMSNINVVAGSPWLRERVEASPLLNKFPINYIPYGTDTDTFRPADQAEARCRFSIPADADVLCFRAVNRPYSVKGTDYIVEALNSINPKRKTYCITMDCEGAVESLRGKYELVELGWVNDQALLADALRASDIFLMPSLEEGFGLMATESMACGTPVIVFEGTALPVTVGAPNSGVVVPRDAGLLAQAISHLLDDRTELARLSEAGKRHVREHHEFKDYAASHLALYRGLMNEQ